MQSPKTLALSYLLLNKGTAEHASPNMTLLATFCNFCMARVYTSLGTAFLEQPFKITGLSK
jgi:hypothetical protein